MPGSAGLGMLSGLGAAFAALGRQRMGDVRMQLAQQQQARDDLLRNAQVRKLDIDAALGSNQLGGLNSIGADLAGAGVDPGRAAIMASAIQANKGANLNTTGQGLGRLFTLGGIGDAAANNTAAGIDNTKVAGGVAFNPTATPDAQNLVAIPDYAQVAGLSLNGAPAFFDRRTGRVPATDGAGLPAETLAYVPKVFGALGANPAFDKSGQPTPELLDAVRQVESGGDPNAVSPKGAQGAYQLMPATAASVGVVNPFDPQQARQGAATYLAQLYQQFGGDARKAIAAYNAGPSRVASGWQPTGGGNGQRAPAGYRFTPDGNLEAIPGGPAANRDYQGGSDATLFGDATKSGQEYVASIPAGNRELVQGLLDGRLKLPSGTTLKSPLWQSVLASVQHADPAWNEQGFQQYAQARRYMTTGAGGRQINTINTAMQHMQKLVDIVDKMNNGAATGLNYLTNQGANLFSKGQLSNFNAVISQVATEMAAVYKGGNAAPTDQEIQHFRAALSPNLGHDKQIEVLRDWTDLLSGKLNSLAEQYQDSMSPLAEPITILKPEARAAFEGIEALNAKLNGGTAAAVPQQPAVYAPGSGVTVPTQRAGNAAASGPVAVNPQTGERIQWNGSAWVPEGGGNG